MESKDKRDILKIVDQRLRTNFSKNIGDTPTDALQLTPKNYVVSQVSSLFSSIQSGFTITGNLVVNGSSSIAGSLSVGSIVSAGITTSGAASIAGKLSVGGTASIAGSLSIGGVPVPAVYTGRVNAAGTSGTPFPPNWTTSFLGTGNYKIVHGFGNSSYSVVVSANTFVATFASISTNDFSVSTLNPAGSSQNDNFNFVVVKP